ncbi:MAG TPA: hypothetical protein VGK46_09975 [Saprospiraceae bacterium]
MKNIGLFILVFLLRSANAQDNPISFLVNEGLLTYVDNTPNTNYTISFVADTFTQSEQASNIFYIDTAMVQFNKFPIPGEMMDMKYDSIGESKLLMHFRDYEFDYMQQEVFARKLDCHSIFFKNQNEKQFLLWYFEFPDDMRNTSPILDLGFEEGDSDSLIAVKELDVDYQLFLAFIANGHVIMLNFPVFNTEPLSDKIESIRSEISQSVRIYGGDINMDALLAQIDHKIRNVPFIIDDSDRGIQFVTPYWLNINTSMKYDLMATFPDIHNISNAMIIILSEKANFGSFKNFENSMLKGKGTKKVEKIEYPKDNISRYKTIYQTDEGHKFICQVVLLNLRDHYGLLNFTSTANTYDQNMTRLDEFVETITIK